MWFQSENPFTQKADFNQERKVEGPPGKSCGCGLEEGAGEGRGL